MKVRARPSAVLSIVSLVAGCDALIGLGEEPSGAAPSSSSTGDGASTSTADATASSTGADVTSVGGGVATATTATGTGGGGGDGGGGDGGAGGGSDPKPCAGCGAWDSSRCVDCDDANDVCRRRIYDVPDAVHWTGNIGADAIFNRFGRGVAITRDHFTFTAADSSGRSRLHVVNRRDGTIATREETLATTSVAPLILDFVLLAEPGSAVLLKRLDVTDPDGDLEGPPPSVTPPALNALGRGGGAVYGGSVLTPDHPGGHGYRLDGFTPCQVTSLSNGGAPGHVAVVRSPATLLISIYDGPAISRTVLPDTSSCVAGTTSWLSISGADRVFASTALDDEDLYAVTRTDDTFQVGLTRLEVDDGTAVPAGPVLPAMAGRALAARAGQILYGHALGGLGACDAALENCVTTVVADEAGQVHEIELTTWGLVTLGYVDQLGDDSDDARIVCMVDR